MTHDPRRHIAYMRQALESDKRPLALFLGAGCPMALQLSTADGTQALIPDIVGLMEITDAAAETSPVRQTYKALKAQVANGNRNANIESLLTHVRALRAVVGTGEIRGVSAKQLDEVETFICEHIAVAVNKPLPSGDTPYHRMAAWIGGMPRHQAVEIFTTNYDLLTEQSLEETRTPFFDGFVGARKPFFDVAAIEDDVLPNRWARLWKIHGSINWSVDEGGNVVRSDSPGKPPLIFPSHLKYEESRRMPYLALLDRLKSFLRRNSAVLVTVGYSYRDDHINEAIVQGLQGNSTTTAFGLLFGPLGDYDTGRRLAERRVNLILLARDSGTVATRSDVYAATDGPSMTGVVAKSAANGGTPPTEVTLGDFQIFAEFLRELVGNQRVPRDVTAS